jgi:hypothetical protein
MFHSLWLTLFSLATFAAPIVKVCDDAAVFKVESLTFTPANPIPGDSGSLVSVFNVPYQIDSGKSTYSCSLNGVPVWLETYDLCTQTECPIMVGSHTSIGSAPIPDIVGKLDCKIRWSYGDTTLMCVEFILKMGSLRAPPYVLH